MVGWIKTRLGMEVGLGPGHTVLDGKPALPPPKKEAQPSPKFLAHVCCGQTAGWIKMPLGMEVGLSPGDVVLDGDPALPTEPFYGPLCYGMVVHPGCCRALVMLKILRKYP